MHQDAIPDGHREELGNSQDNRPQQATEQALSLPEGGYGWVCTVCIAVANGHSWGINSAYSVFLAYYVKNETFPGATPLQYAFVGSVSIACTLMVSPLSTIAVREIGTRPTMLFGALLQSVSLAWASLTPTIWQLFLSQGALFGIGMGLLFIPSYGIVAQWFTRRRALANGIAIAGAGIGGLVYSLGSGAMIRSLGLAWALRTLCIISFVVNVVCTLFIRDRYKEIGSKQLAFDMSLFRRSEYVIILAFGCFSMLGYFILIFTLANYANEIGLDSSQASVIPALFMLGQAAGRPIIGYFADSVGYMNMATLTTVLIGLFSLVIWINAKTYGVLIFFALAQGLVAGSFWVTISPMLAEVIGLKNLPSGLTILWLVLAVPSAFSAPIALEIADSTGSYLGSQLFTGFSFMAAGICMGMLRSWKIAQIIGDGLGEQPGAREVGNWSHVIRLFRNFFTSQRV